MVSVCLEVFQIATSSRFHTGAGEAQCFTTASAVAEWMSLLLAEAKHGAFDLRTREQVQQHALGHVQLKCGDEVPVVNIIGVTDCKSLYDHVASTSAMISVLQLTWPFSDNA